MNRKIALAVTGTAAAALTCGVTLTSVAATGGHHSVHSNAAAKNKFHTMHYDAHRVSLVPVDKLDRVATLNLRSRHIASAGKLEGGGVFTCHQKAPQSESINCHTAIALRGGIIVGRAKLSFATFKLVGVVTGGTGAYKGAHGTLSVVSDTSKHSIITLKYKL